mgnify:CR=1 FL=1
MKFDAKNIVIIILIILIVLSVAFIAFSLLGDGFDSKDLNYGDSDSKDIDSASKDGFSSSYNQTYPDGPTAEAKIDSSGVPSKLIGSNSLGTVEVLGPFGNADSDVRIAYLIGMHPLESKAHKALFDTVLSKNDSLNYCYYIYKINVSSLDDGDGRMNGQLLAQEFLAPEVISQGYDLVVDVHSNNGMIEGTYEESNFIFATGRDEKSENVVYKLLSKLDKLVYYFPEQQSSPPYITLPVEQSGTPTINYETYNYEPLSTTYDLMNDFVDEVDKLDF